MRPLLTAKGAVLDKWWYDVVVALGCCYVVYSDSRAPVASAHVAAGLTVLYSTASSYCPFSVKPVRLCCLKV